MPRKDATVVTGMRGAEHNPLMGAASPDTPPVAPVYPAAEPQDGEWIFQSSVRQLQVSLKITRAFVKGDEHIPGETRTARFREHTFRTDDPFEADALIFEMAPNGKFKLDPKTKKKIPNKNFGVGQLYWLKSDAESMATEAVIDSFKAMRRKAMEDPRLAKRLSDDPELKDFALPDEEAAATE